MDRDFFHPLSEWKRVSTERGERVFRLERDLGEAKFWVSPGFVLVYRRKGVREWNGQLLRSWVEATEIGLKAIPEEPTVWYVT